MTRVSILATLVGSLTLCGCAAHRGAHVATPLSNADALRSVPPSLHPRIVRAHDRHDFPFDEPAHHGLPAHCFCFEVLEPAAERGQYVHLHYCDIPGQEERFARNGGRYLLYLRPEAAQSAEEFPGRQSCYGSYLTRELR